MKEVWKDILNYEGLYQVSNLGKIKSVDRKVKYRNSMKNIKEKNYISKDKIKEKIDKLKEDKYNVNTPHCSYWYNIKIETLLELLESEE